MLSKLGEVNLWKEKNSLAQLKRVVTCQAMYAEEAGRSEFMEGEKLTENLYDGLRVAFLDGRGSWIDKFGNLLRLIPVTYSVTKMPVFPLHIKQRSWAQTVHKYRHTNVRCIQARCNSAN
jgi:hypothetical protein